MGGAIDWSPPRWTRWLVAAQLGYVKGVPGWFKAWLQFFDREDLSFGEFLVFTDLSLLERPVWRDAVVEAFRLNAQELLWRSYRRYRRIPDANSFRVVVKTPLRRDEAPIETRSTIAWKCRTTRAPRLFRKEVPDELAVIRQLHVIDASVKRCVYVALSAVLPDPDAAS